MEKFITSMLKSTAKNLPVHWLASYLKKNTLPCVDESRRRAGGFLKGICHPKSDYEQVKTAGFQWMRNDVAFPFDKDGNLREEYLKKKEEWRSWRDQGIRIFAVTPFPKHFAAHGIDPRLPENENRIREIALFLLEDLRDIVGAFQIANEQGTPQFTRPLNIDQAARFLGIQLEAMYPRRGDILIGYNAVMIQCDLHEKMRPWHKYCDYVGTDIYIGCFAPVGNFMYMFDMMLRYLWSMTGLPVIVTEFGYISGGAPKTKEEKRAILQRYGVSSEKEAREKIGMVMENIQKANPKLYDYTVRHASGGYADFLFKLPFCNHLYSELPKLTVIKKHPHTPEGQASFYRDIFPRLAKLPFVIGAFVYCWKDSERCYVCGQDDCPTETRWGLVDVQGNEKPSYYAVRDALKNI
jgi:hypothetical protein